MGPLAALRVPTMHALSLTVIGTKVLRSMSTSMLHSGFVRHKEEIETMRVASRGWRCEAALQLARAVAGDRRSQAGQLFQCSTAHVVLLTVPHHTLAYSHACNSGNPRKAQACRVSRNVVPFGICRLLRILFSLQRQVSNS